jgi:hypothetical protein
VEEIPQGIFLIVKEQIECCNYKRRIWNSQRKPK